QTRIQRSMIGIFLIICCILNYTSYAIEGQENETQKKEFTLTLDEVFKEKTFLSTFKKAGSEETFRIVVKPRNQQSVSIIKHMIKNYWEFQSYSGLAITATKEIILYLISKQVFLEIWENSIIKASIDPTYLNSFPLVRGICNYTEKVGASTLWSDGYYGNGTIIAILDTGIKQNHPALNQTMDGEARIINSKNFFDNSSNVEDDNGHGTEVAGIIGSNGRFGFMRGVAPNCNFLVGKILTHTAEGTIETLIKGIDWAIENNADVINLSLGKVASDKNSPDVEAANYAMNQGAVVCAAAGNSRSTQQFGYNDFYTILSPGIATQVITVGAVDNNDILYEHSSAGPVVINYNDTDNQFLFDTIDLDNNWLKPDVLAPGVMLNTTSKDGLTTKRVSGTSYSTAVVSGICALLLQRFNNKSSSLIKAALLDTSEEQFIQFFSPFSEIVNVGLSPMIQGAGIVNAPASSNYLLNPPPITIWPSVVPIYQNTLFNSS
ncbi:MAG: S8 family peptidase, partial [Candidatus Heimdallarchaeaceae archaeon]